MPNRTVALLLVACFAVLGPTIACCAEKEKPSEDKLRVLVITGGHDYEVPQFNAMFAAIPDIVAEQVTFPDAAALLKPELADKYDVVVLYDMWVPGFTPEQQQAFVALLNRGIGLVALHHTLGAHPQWPEYANIIGGRFWVQPRTVDGQTIPASEFYHDMDIQVHVADAEHPITRGLKDFQIHDETYKNYDTDPKARVLLTTEHPKSDSELAWVKQYGNSRVVYLELGHDHFAYENPTYRTLVARSIRWTAGRAADPESPAQKLFNGKDLTGWTEEGEAVWEVKGGELIGRQGANNTSGDLFTTGSYDDFELTVTYRIVWPANSGVWYRYQGGEKTFQADILEYQNPVAYSGSLYRPGVAGEPFAAINKDASLVNREGWNTLVIRAVGNRQVIFLNGKKVVDVRADVSDRGRIGFQVHPGDEFGKMQIIVRDVAIRSL